MEYSLRRATEADRDWLDQLRRAAYQGLFYATWGHWDEERHQKHFDHTWEEGDIDLIELDGNPVGMVQVGDLEGCIELREIQILPDYQNRGLGTRVIRDVMDRARRDRRDIVLSTGLQNGGAHRLYQSLGFVDTGRTDDKIHMRWNSP